MIISSGQIITGRAASTVTEGVKVVEDADGYARSAYKALVAPESLPADADAYADFYGLWVETGAAGKDDLFVGVVGDDTVPTANINVNTNKPYVGTDRVSQTFVKGDVMTIERNGILSVIAGGDIKRGDFLKLGADGSFVKGEKSDQIGRAHQSAKTGERFRAYIGAM